MGLPRRTDDERVFFRVSEHRCGIRVGIKSFAVELDGRGFGCRAANRVLMVCRSVSAALEGANTPSFAVVDSAGLPCWATAP